MKLFDLLSKYKSLEELPQFANEMNVGALLYDEVVASGDNPFDTIGLMQLSQASQIQSKLWYVQKENIRRLSVFCAKHGIKMLIFKGYAMSLLYDKPESRKSGDVDVFFFEEEFQGLRFKVQSSRFKVQGSRFKVQGSRFKVQGSRFKVQGSGSRDPEIPRSRVPEIQNASHKMDELVKAKGRELEIGDKHSSFNVRETHIENHRHFVGTEEHPKLQDVEDYLLKQIYETLRYENENEALRYENENENETLRYENCHPGDMLIKSDEWPNVYYPSPNFNAVFLPLHMGEHFVNEGASLHQLLDWIVFLEKCGDQVDWPKVYELADKCGFRKWLDGISEFGISGIRDLRNHEVLDEVNSGNTKCSTKSILSSTRTFRTPEILKSRDPEIQSSGIPQKVLQELFASRPYDRESREHTPLKYLWDRTIMTFRDGWKIRMVYDESPMRWFLRHAWNYVRKDGSSGTLDLWISGSRE